MNFLTIENCVKFTTQIDNRFSKYVWTSITLDVHQVFWTTCANDQISRGFAPNSILMCTICWTHSLLAHFIHSATKIPIVETYPNTWLITYGWGMHFYGKWKWPPFLQWWVSIFLWHVVTGWWWMVTIRKMYKTMQRSE